MFKLNRHPLTVIVVNGRYECYGPSTMRSYRLYELLRKQGGIDPSIPDGEYYYNVKWVKFRFVATLTPIVD